MQRLIDLFRQQAIGFYGEENVRRFNADFELIEVQTIEVIHMAHSGFQQRLRRRLTVFFLQIFFQRSGVDADTDRNIFITSAVHYRANTLFITDIAWVDTQAIDAVFRHLQRDTIVEVNIGNQRDIRPAV